MFVCVCVCVFLYCTVQVFCSLEIKIINHDCHLPNFCGFSVGKENCHAFSLDLYRYVFVCVFFLFYFRFRITPFGMKFTLVYACEHPHTHTQYSARQTIINLQIYSSSRIGAVIFLFVALLNLFHFKEQKQL